MSYNPTDFFVKKATNNDVKIEHDPSVITRKSERKKMSAKDIAEYQREASRGGQIGSKQANMGLASSMSKSNMRKLLLLMQKLKRKGLVKLKSKRKWKRKQQPNH